MPTTPIFTCDFSQSGALFPHFWERLIGSGHAPLALRADWQQQLARCQRELGIQSVRFHGLLSSPMDTILCRDNQTQYSFFNLDQICDFLLSIGMKPWLELSFMPATLASGSETVMHYASNVTPPKDFTLWSDLISTLARHLVARYGLEEVRRWHFEVWNEPNMDGFWSGTQDEYFDLYRHTVTALKNVDAKLQVGGPATAQNAWLGEFIEFCAREKLPCDFVSTHHYPTDALGKPGDDTVAQLAAGHRGILREQAATARAQVGDKLLFYTEWNSSSNPRDDLHDRPYAAAFDLKTVLGMQGVVDIYSLWTFSDIFVENQMPERAFQGGFGLLTMHGIAKPAYRAFQLLHRLGDEQLKISGEHNTVNAWCVRDESARRATILLCNHALPRHEIARETVQLTLRNLTAPRCIIIERIDDEHTNARALWEKLGSPAYPTPRQHEWLEVASQMVPEALAFEFKNGEVALSVEVPPHGIAAITLEFGDEAELKSVYCD